MSVVGDASVLVAATADTGRDGVRSALPVPDVRMKGARRFAWLGYRPRAVRIGAPKARQPEAGLVGSAHGPVPLSSKTHDRDLAQSLYDESCRLIGVSPTTKGFTA